MLIFKSSFKKYLFNTTWLLIEKTLRIISGIFIGVWIARYLGPKDFGIFNYVIAFSSLFASISKLGLENVLVKELVNYPQKRDWLIGTSFWLKATCSFLVILVIVGLLGFSYDSMSNSKMIIIVSFGIFFQTFDVIEIYFQSQVKAKIISICKIFQLIFSSILKVYLISVNAALINFVYVLLFDSITLALSYYFAYFNIVKKTLFNFFSFRLATRLLKESYPFIIITLVLAFNSKIDQILIMNYINSSYLGYYSAALTLSTSWHFILTIIATTLFTSVINAKKQGDFVFQQRIQYYFTLMLWIAILISLFISINSLRLVELLYGKEYHLSSEVLSIHVWGSIPVAFGIVWTQWILVENSQRFIIIFHLIALFCNVILNLYFLPRFGIIGAAITSVLASVFSQFIGVLFYRRTITQRFFLRALFPMYLIKK